MRDLESLLVLGTGVIITGSILASIYLSTVHSEDYVPLGTEEVPEIEPLVISMQIQDDKEPVMSDDEMYSLIAPTLKYYTESDTPAATYPTLAAFDAKTFQVNRSYNIPKEFYYDILPENMHCLVEGICNLEATQDISSMFLFAIAATEVGWDADFAGNNNWFNWTPDAKEYQDFSSTEACITYTGKRFKECFFNPEWHALYGDTVDDYFTIDEINSKYALNDDGTVNTYWGEVVGEIIGSFHKKYADWVISNDT